MKKTAIIALLMGLAIGAQTASIKSIYGYDGTKKMWFTLGPTLTVNAAGQLDAVLPTPTATKVRSYDVALTYDPVTKLWGTLPATATGIVIHVNGVRYRALKDYSVNAGKVLSLSDNMPADAQVTADYDQ